MKQWLFPLLQDAHHFLLWSLVFGVSYTQAALYYSNQNQYFLHGMAHAGRGHLDQDWLANTRDPTPIFSFMVEMTYRFLDERLFHVYYILMLGCYFHNLVILFTLLTGGRANPLTKLVFMTLLVALHAGLLRLASAHLLGVDYPWYFQAGVAGQYILGFGLQPSVAGVLLIASIVACVREHPWRAIFWACLAGILHGTYLLGAAMLVLSYMYLQYRQSGIRAAFLHGLVALVLVSPVVIYNFVSFSPSSAEEFAEAQRILAHTRIPHHAEPARWCDGIALAQVAWIVLGIVLVWRSNLFVILLITFGLSLLLTGVQVATNNDTLALLFPWRTSAILVPIASTIILARLVHLLDARLARLPADASLHGSMACGMALGAFVTVGICINVSEWGYRTNPDELAMLKYVAEQERRGDVYLLPVQVPRSGAGPRGAGSTNFKPALRAGKSGELIAIDLQRFRIFTGTPIYVDFKSIPYRDTDVLEWHRRLLWAHALYADRDWNSSTGKRDELIAAGITHVVVATDRDIRCDALKLEYKDRHYRIYRVPSSTSAGE